MTESELAALEALANAASPGPWDIRGKSLTLHGPATPPYQYGPFVVGFTDNDSTRDEDLDYIAAMHPKTTLGLIAEVRRLRELVESAYREGWHEMEFRDSYGDAREVPQLNFDWQESASRKALDP